MWRMVLRSLVAVALLAAIDGSPATAQPRTPPRFWAGLEPGPHAVGFRVLTAKSASLLPGIETRPLEIAVWYPANASRGEALTFGDYFRRSPDLLERSLAEGVSAVDLEKILSIAVTGTTDALSQESAREVLASPMAGRENAAPSSGRFPVVLWSARYGTTSAQSVMSEYLASHGYIVGFARPARARWKLPFELKSADEKADEIESQLLDLRGGLAAIRELPDVDAKSVAVIGWSYAGESATRLQRTDTEIDLVVGLSTNTLSQWVYQGDAALGALADGPLEVPHVVITQAKGADGTPRVRPATWDLLPRGSAFISIPEIGHGNFNVVEGLLPALLGIEKVQPWSTAGEGGKVGYVAVARTVRAFLDDHFGRGKRVSIAALETLLPKGSSISIRSSGGREPIAFEPVEIALAEGASLTAELYRAPRPAGCVALFHQSGASRGEYRSIAPWLVRAGYTAVAVDLRAGYRDRWNRVWNESARRAGTFEARERGDMAKLRETQEGANRDILTSVRWLAAKPECGRRVIAWGSSFSANRAIKIAVEHPDDVRAVVAFSPGEYDANDPEQMRRTAAGLTVPTFIAWGRGEAEVVAAIPPAIPVRNATYASPLGFHGSSILFDDPAAWSALRAFLESLTPR